MDWTSRAARVLPRRRLSRAGLAVAAVVLLAGSSAAAASSQDPAPSGGVIYASFANASPLLPGEDVKEYGVTVGSVGQATLSPAHTVAVVPLKLSPSAFPLHTDATAQVAPVSLLGENYVDLVPGSSGKPLLQPGEQLPVSRTSSAVTLQQVLNTVNDPTGKALSALIGTLGQGANGNGANIRAALGKLAPAMNNTSKLAAVLQQQNQLLNSVIDTVQPVTSALARDKGVRLSHLVDSTRQVLNATTARNQQLRQAIQALPGTLRQAQRTFAQLTATSQSATTTLGNLRPTTDNLRAISRELNGFSQAATPALASANPLLDRANQLLVKARPVAAELTKAVPDLNGTTANAAPIVKDLNGNLANVLDFIRYWALTTNGTDGLSHYFRALLVANTQQVTGLSTGSANGAPRPGTQSTPRPRVNTPSSSSGSGGPLGGGTPNPSTSPGGSATGLSPQQEKGMLGFLTGGS